MEFNASMQLALEEARLSLREGNKGFGAVIAKDGCIISRAHDLETTAKDPTSHAEMNAIKEASGKLGSFAGCVLVSTHEPCPMCATAAVWAGIPMIAYGYSIKDAIRQSRRRIDLTAREIFERAGVNIKIHENVLALECSVLYRRDVRAEIEKLRNADDAVICALNADSVDRRTKWFNENREKFQLLNGDIVNCGYRLLLERFGITESEAPVIKKTEKQIVFHSKNFCPTLEACKILGLDTRDICRKLNENATDVLVKQIDPRLKFCRNYEKLRPYADYCEEMILVCEE